MTTTKTVSDFRPGDQVISIKVRDSMPIGSTGVVVSIVSGQPCVKVDPNGMWPRGTNWYYYPHELDHMLVDIIGDNDDDCI